MSRAKCPECKKVKELTNHGTCFKCHISSIQLTTAIEARKK